MNLFWTLVIPCLSIYLKVMSIKIKEQPSLKPTYEKLCFIIVEIMDITTLFTRCVLTNFFMKTGILHKLQPQRVGTELDSRRQVSCSKRYLIRISKGPKIQIILIIIVLSRMLGGWALNWRFWNIRQAFGNQQNIIALKQHALKKIGNYSTENFSNITTILSGQKFIIQIPLAIWKYWALNCCRIFYSRCSCQYPELLLNIS